MEPSGDVWVALSDEVLPAAEASSWVSEPRCGAIVTFSGVVRDHSPGRTGVVMIEYEAYEAHVERLLAEIATSARHQWPDIGRVALLHRSGAVGVGEASVLVAVAAPHRADAFEAARFCIDTIKETVPIWKLEHWADGSDWSACSPTVEAHG